MFNLFKKNKSKDIFNPMDNINIDDYVNLDLNEKEYVNNLIKEYKVLFKGNNSIIDIDNDIYNEFKMYQELIINIISNLDTCNILDSIISLLKLKIYLDELNKIYDKLKYKFIALKELKNNKEYIRNETIKYYLGRRKININTSLFNLIDNINLSLVNTYTLISVVNKEIVNLCSLIVNINIDDYNKNINDRLNKINNDYKLIFNTDLDINNNLTKLVIKEMELEKFTYLNKDKKEELLNKLNDISNMEITNKEEQLEIINNLIKIKIYFNIFNTYGRNIINMEELNDLYQIIFNVYTYFPYNCIFNEYYSSLDNENELEYYKNIIRYKINLFKEHKSNIFNYQSISQDVYDFLVNIFNNININNIIKYNLSLLLSLDYKDGIKEYYNNQLIDIDNLEFSKVLDKKMVLGEYIKFSFGQSEESHNDISYLSNNIDFILYSKVYDINNIDYNYLPEGIKYFTPMYFSHYLKKCERFRPIIFPNTVKDINIYLDRYYTVYYVLPDVIDDLYIYDNDKNNNNTKILMPLEITNSVRLLDKLDNIDLIFRKDIIDFDKDKLFNYFYLIFHIYFESKINQYNCWCDEISDDFWYDDISMKSIKIDVNEFLKIINIKDDRGRIESIPIKYNINSINNEETFMKFIMCIVDSIYKYKLYNYKLSNTNNKIKKLKKD